MGNCISSPTARHRKKGALPIDTMFRLPSPLPPWPRGGGFATGTINLGGGVEVCQVTTFKKIWASSELGPDSLGATFYEPCPIPDGFSVFGCYAQPNNTPLFGWVLVGKDVTNDVSAAAALKMPVDYELVWSSSELMKINKHGNGYIWLPIPPAGYTAVGFAVTDTTAKPPLDKVRCVRSDLAEACEKDSLIWGTSRDDNKDGIGVYGLKPTARGTQALGVSVGTFVVEITTATTALPLSCLKNTNPNSSCMPNVTQIEALVQAYSPLIYLHPDEKYMPSSVNWFFEKGALLYKKGDEMNPISVNPNGSNLPQGGSNDGEYWLDLPEDERSKDDVEKGDLQSSVTYLHIKPMLGGTFTDISMWIFYPFNGPATAKVQLIDIPLGKIGRHVGDWEHVTLRISNFTGELRRVYFSQHSSGAWSNASELEFENGNRVVAYASLNGHAFYPKAGLVLQGNSKLAIGIRNDTAKSNLVMDTSKSYKVMSADYLGTVAEPPWLNYNREWGPKISSDIGKELEVVEKLLPGKLRSVFKRVIGAIPSEVFGEEGPTGPKMKQNWSGDEVQNSM